VTRHLRILKPTLPPRSRGTVRGAAAMFWWGIFAILLQFLLPYVVLSAMGIDPAKVKLHPATVVVICCGVYALLQGIVPFHQRGRDEPGLLIFIFVMPILAMYSIFFTGSSGSAVYPETFLSAGFLALMLETASQEQKRFLAKLLVTLCVLNVFVAVYESATFSNWFPLVIDPDVALVDIDVDFRANAFFGHPLNASLITSMAIFLLYAMRLRFIIAGPIFGILLVGQLAYGGRTALFVTLIIAVMVAIWRLFSGIVRRNLKLDFVIAMISAAVVVPVLIAVVATHTSMADRIIDSLQYDDGSAAARVTQWEVFKLLSLKDWLFGISHNNLKVLKYQIGLGGTDTDIENFWILLLLNLGVIGFAVLAVVFGAFLFHLGRYSRDLNGWLLIISALIIDSGSNSLGVKTNDLFIATAFLVSMSGYADYTRSPRILTSRIRNHSWTSERQRGALGHIPAARSRGLRTLGPRAF
jgi:hypothetical protein